MATILGKRHVLPGDRLATIEEFTSGKGSAVVGDSVVSTLVGEVHPDMANRVMNVEAIKGGGVEGVPRDGDIIIGTVQSAQPSIVQVNIDAVNNAPSYKQFAGMLSLRDDRRRRTSSPIKPGDVIRAVISSTKNSIFHLSLDCEDCGVLYTICNVCGGNVFAVGRDRVKCRECGWVEDRLLSEEFIKYSRSQQSNS